MSLNTDTDYIVTGDEFAESAATNDVDYENKSILIEVRDTVNELIRKHNSLDVFDANKKTQPLDMNAQVYANKKIVEYLRTFKEFIDNKVKELPNGR